MGKVPGAGDVLTGSAATGEEVRMKVGAGAGGIQTFGEEDCIPIALLTACRTLWTKPLLGCGRVTGVPTRGSFGTKGGGCHVWDIC